MAALVLVLYPVAQAGAHALVVESTPAPNATVAGQDVDLRVRFSDRIDKKRSKLGLASAAGQAYPVQLLEVESVDTLAGHVAGLPAGAYRLQWQVLAVDGHITRGEIPFTATAP
jgi:copper resistance protein C